MRRFTMLIAMAATVAFGMQTQAFSQATKNKVIVEVGTGTWCQYCPGAALGCDDLMENGAPVGIVEHHDNDPYSYASGDARYGSPYYNITGFPTAYFDGMDSIVGGSHTQTMYNSYNQNVNDALSVSTPFGITTSWVQNGNNIDVTVEISQVGAYSGQVRMQAVLTESHLQVNWQGLTECNFVNRYMYPNQNGTPITVTQGNTVTQTFSMPINAAWNQDDMELVVWLENPATKHIFNGTQEFLLTPSAGVDPSAIAVLNETGLKNCLLSIAPVVKVRNMGNSNLTSIDFTYHVNYGTPMTYTWNGNIAFPDYATITLPAISYIANSSYFLSVDITNANDVQLMNNHVQANWLNADFHATGSYVFFLQQDNYGSETSWDFKTASGSVVASGGPYTNNNNAAPITQNIALSTADCYTFTIHDSYGDGICCAFGNGSYSVTDPNSNVVISGGSFESSEKTAWTTDHAVALNNALATEVSVFPNPGAGVFNVDLGKSYDNAEITVMNVAGQIVYKTTTAQALVKMDLSSLANGMYVVKVKTEEGTSNMKITKE
jgi:hypothetical protein